MGYVLTVITFYPNLTYLTGFFDIVAELWPHVAIVIYRAWPEKHRMLEHIFRVTAILELVGTTVETIVVFSIFASVWKHWTLEFKILSPLLHVLFSCAQVFGAWVFWDMARKQVKLANGKKPEPNVELEVVVVCANCKREQERTQARVTVDGMEAESMV